MADPTDDDKTPDRDEDLPAQTATQTLAALGLIGQTPSAKGPAPTSTLPDLMNPSDDSESIIPSALIRPDDAVQVEAARAAQEGKPVLPPGTPPHGQGTGPQGFIPPGLIRPEEAGQLAQPAAFNPQLSPHPNVTPQAPQGAQPMQVQDVGPAETALGAAANLDTANRQDQAAEDRATKSQLAAQQAQGEANQTRAQQLADIDKREIDSLDMVDRTHGALRGLAEAKAGVETAQWMQKIDDMVRKEPDPGRIFHGEGGGMRRALWFASIMATAIGNRKHPERANVMLQMLEHTIDDDVKLQQNQQAKELEGAKMHLQAAQADKAMALGDLRDDRSQSTARILAVGRFLRDRAALPGPADQKAGYLAAAAAMDQLAAKKAAEVHKDAKEAYQKSLDRQKDYDVAGIKEQGALARTRIEEYGKNTRQVQQQQFEVGPDKEAFEARKEGREFTNKALLAPIEAGEKAKAEITANAAPVNTGLGISSGRDAQGNPIPLVMRREAHDKAGEIVAGANEAWKNYTELHDILKDVSVTDFVAGSPKLNAVKSRIEAATARDLHGGGRVSESFVKLAGQAGTGISPTVSGRALEEARGQLDEIRSLVDDRLRDMPKDVPNSIRALDPNNTGTIEWTPPSLRGEKPAAPSVSDLQRAAGIPGSAGEEAGRGGTRPVTVKEIEDVDSGKRSAPTLDPRADQQLKDAETTFGWGAKGEAPAGMLPEQIRDLSKAYEDRIRSTGVMDDRHSSQVIPEGQREDSATRLRLKAEHALNAANEHMHATLQTDKYGSVQKLYEFDAFKKAAAKDGGFNVNDPETEKALRRTFDKFHDTDGSVNYEELGKLLKETEERFR